MKGTTPKTRSRALEKELKRLYDPEGGKTNVVDILTDLLHLCHEKEWDFANALDIAQRLHFPTEQQRQHI